MRSPNFQSVSPEHPTTEADCRPEQEVFVNLLRSYDCLWSEQGKFFARFGVTPQQYNVLNVLASRDEGAGVACQAIGEKLLNRVPDITRLLDRLEQAGLIWRERCCADRRVVRTHLTDAGRSKVAEIRVPLEEALRQRFAHMTREEVLELNRLLHKLREPACAHAKAAFLAGEVPASEVREP
jgi:DNA-binding MarR family transcriptional regulator